jgi:hypothetical protein
MALFWRLNHDLVYLRCSLEVESAAISFDHRCVYDGVWLDSKIFIFLILREDFREDLFGFLDMTIPDARIDETSECNIVVNDWLFALKLLALENIESHVHVTQLSIGFDEDAHLDRHIVVMLVRLFRVDLELCNFELSLMLIKSG